MWEGETSGVGARQSELALKLSATSTSDRLGRSKVSLCVRTRTATSETVDTFCSFTYEMILSGKQFLNSSSKIRLHGLTKSVTLVD